MIAISCWPWRLLRHYVCDHCVTAIVERTACAKLWLLDWTLDAMLLCCPLLGAAFACWCCFVIFMHEGISLGLGHLAMQIIKLMKISIISVNPRQLHASQSPYWAAYRRKSGYGCHLYLLKGKYHLWIAICWRQLVAAILLVLLCNKYQWRFIMDKVLG